MYNKMTKIALAFTVLSSLSGFSVAQVPKDIDQVLKKLHSHYHECKSI